MSKLSGVIMKKIKVMFAVLAYGIIPGAVLTLLIHRGLSSRPIGPGALIFFFALGIGIFSAMYAERGGKLTALMPVVLLGQIFAGGILIGPVSLGMALYICVALIFSGDAKRDVFNVLMASLGFLGVLALHIRFYS